PLHFSNNPPPPQISTLSLHDALPISRPPRAERSTRPPARRRRNGSTTWNPPLVRFVSHHITLKWGQTPFFSFHFSHLRILLTHRSEEHTSELQSRGHLVCRLLLEKKK